MKALLRKHLAQAGPDLLALLDPAQGLIEAPIRAEIFGSARFQQHGRSLGQTHAAQGRAPRAVAFTPRLRDNIEVLRRAHASIGRLERNGRHVSPAGEWLLDNYCLVVAQIQEIQDGLPRRYFRDLPVLVDVHLAGLPRIYGVAWAFVAHTDSAFDEALLGDFLAAYQETRELTLGELWALPTTLRLVLIENLRRLAEGVAAAKAARELANQWCDHPTSPGGVDLGALFDAMDRRGVGPDFALQVTQRLQAATGTPASSAEADPLAWQLVLARALPNPAASQARQQASEAADNLSVSNAIPRCADSATPTGAAWSAAAAAWCRHCSSRPSSAPNATIPRTTACTASNAWRAAAGAANPRSPRPCST